MYSIASSLTRLQKWAFAKELKQLAKYQRQDPNHSDWWQKRTDQQKQAISRTSTLSCLTKLGDDSISRINIFRNLVHHTLIQSANTFERGFWPHVFAKFEDIYLQTQILDKSNLGERCSFAASDQVLLDGLFLKPNPSLQAKDVLLIGLPNGMAYEAFSCYFLRGIEKDFLANDCDIFFYNDKGIGRSPGRNYSLIKAAVSALDFLHQKNYENIHVCGFSLGSGVMAQAVKKYAKDSKISQKKIKSFTSVHSFSNLYSCIRRLISSRLINVHFIHTDKIPKEPPSPYSVPLAWISIPVAIGDQDEWIVDVYACTLGVLVGVINVVVHFLGLTVSLLLPLFGVRILDTEAALSDPNFPAKKIKIINYDRDLIIRPSAQIRKKPENSNIEIINNDGNSHLDWDAFFVEFFKEHKTPVVI